MPQPYKLPQDQSSDANGVVLVATGALIPNNPELGAWRDYQDWLAVPNTVDPATATTLADKRRQARLEVDRQAEREFSKDLQIEFDGGRQSSGYLWALYEEARKMQSDGSPTAPNYPLHTQLPAAFGANLTAKGTTIWNEWLARASRTGSVGAVWKDSHRQINAAGSLAAVDAVVAAITWPA